LCMRHRHIMHAALCRKNALRVCCARIPNARQFPFLRETLSSWAGSRPCAVRVLTCFLAHLVCTRGGPACALSVHQVAGGDGLRAVPHRQAGPGARVTRPKPAVTHGVNNAFIRTWRRSQPDSRVTLGKCGVCASYCLGGTPHCPQCVLPVRTHEGGRPPVVTHSESVTDAIVTHVLLAVECHGDRWLQEPGTCERALVLYSSPASSSAGGARVAAQALQSVFVELHSSEERAMRNPSHPLRASSPWACLAVVRSYDRAHHQWWRPLVVRGGCSQHATAGRIRDRPQQSRRG
jgi:hypothetical protein